MNNVLIFANGVVEDGIMVHRALDEAADAYIIAADGGYYIAQHYQRKPHIIIGDLDSIKPDDVSALAETDVSIQAFPPEKDETDLELALLHAATLKADWIRIIGALGGRVDQLIANIYLLALPQLEQADVAIVAGNQMLWMLRPGTHSITGQVGDTLSLIPMNGAAKQITTSGLQYALHDENLLFGPARGISNVFKDENAKIIFSEGLLLTIHTIGRA